MVAIAANDVWAVGFSLNLLNDVSALAADDVWATGYTNQGYDEQNGEPLDDTLTLHYDGTSWTIVPSPSPSSLNQLNSIAAVNGQSIWAVGEYYNDDPQLQRVETLAERFSCP